MEKTSSVVLDIRTRDKCDENFKEGPQHSLTGAKICCSCDVHVHSSRELIRALAARAFGPGIRMTFTRCPHCRSDYDTAESAVSCLRCDSARMTSGHSSPWVNRSEQRAKLFNELTSCAIEKPFRAGGLLLVR